MTKVPANAQPEKRLFISLLTRDISLSAAVLDLIDNSINSSVILENLELRNPEDYLSLIRREPTTKLPAIKIFLSEDEFTIEDQCGGISFAAARDEVFRFGRPPSDDEDTGDREDTLSVYGIGLKRALFKIGNSVNMTSTHPETGFTLDLDVRAWERKPQKEWSFDIEPREGKLNGHYGTKITIKELYPEIKSRIGDGKFRGDLVRNIARTYSYYLERVVSVEVEDDLVEPVDLELGDNRAMTKFELGEVSCTIIAGIAIPRGKFYEGEAAGWYIFCNGRGVSFAEKTSLTGWGIYLPNYQPKFRPFLGLVFFTSDLPELLPWTTTKASINQESAVWQQALRTMGVVGKQITSVLDQQYSTAGAEISREQLQDVAGPAVSALQNVAASARPFRMPVIRKTTTRVCFDAEKSEIEEVKRHLGRRSVSNVAVGRMAFDHFLDNVVREE